MAIDPYKLDFAIVSNYSGAIWKILALRTSVLLDINLSHEHNFHQPAPKVREEI